MTNESIILGNPVTRYIELSTIGLLAQQLPDFYFKNTKKIKIYSDKPELKTILKNNDISSKKKVKIIYLPLRKGEIILPSFKLLYWNTLKEKWQLISLPEKKINVIADSQKKFPQLSQQPREKLKKEISQVKPAMLANKINKHIWVLVILFASLWLITLSLWFVSKIKNHNFIIANKLSNTLTINCRLKKACKNNNSQLASDILLIWARNYWTSKTILNLADIALLINHATFSDRIIELQSILYGKNQNNTWDGKAFWTDWKLWKKMHSRKKNL